MSCEKQVQGSLQLATTVLAGEMSPRKAFDEVLSQLRRQGTPSGVDLAESIIAKSGGVEQLADWIVSDIRNIRGEGKTQDQLLFHEVDFKTLKSLYQLIQRILRDRDQLVKDAKDPLDQLNEDDLMSLIAEGARERLTVDPGFREEIVALINEIDPDLIEQIYLSRYGIPFVVRK